MNWTNINWKCGSSEIYELRIRNQINERVCFCVFFLCCCFFVCFVLVFASSCSRSTSCEYKKKLEGKVHVHHPIQSDLLHSGVATSYIISLSNKKKEKEKERKKEGENIVSIATTLWALNSQQKGVKLRIKSRKKRNYYILSRHLNEKKNRNFFLFVYFVLRVTRNRVM